MSDLLVRAGAQELFLLASPRSSDWICGRNLSFLAARLYGSGADWAHDLAERRMAGGDTAAVVDAAFALYAREAADYAGGRQVEHRVRRD